MVFIRSLHQTRRTVNVTKRSWRQWTHPCCLPVCTMTRTTAATCRTETWRTSFSVWGLTSPGHRSVYALFKDLSGACSNFCRCLVLSRLQLQKRNSYQQLQSDLGKDPFMVESLCMTTVGRTARIPPQRINVGVGFYILGA